MNDVPGGLVLSGHKKEARQGDEGVSPPIGEPRISSDHRLLRTLADQECIDTSPKCFGKAVWILRGLVTLHPPDTFLANEVADLTIVNYLAGQSEGLLPARLQVKQQFSWRPPVFLKIETTLLFEGKLHLPIPLGKVVIASGVTALHGREIMVRLPGHPLRRDRRFMGKGTVFMVEGVIIPACEHRTYSQFN